MNKDFGNDYSRKSHLLESLQITITFLDRGCLADILQSKVEKLLARLWIEPTILDFRSQSGV